jgi:hypothetical protein
MTEFIDGLARSMAKPMPRRRALRLLGGALVSVAVPGITARRAGATPNVRDCGADSFLCKCNCGGPTGDICQTTCCQKDVTACDCRTVQLGPICRCLRQCGSRCCARGQYCASAKSALCCNTSRGQGEEESCVSGRAAVCCPPGLKCCSWNEVVTCCNALTQSCGDQEGSCACKRGNTRRCGRDCCNPKSQKCCPGPGSQKHCAPKDSICCGRKWCPKTQRCCKGAGGGGIYPGIAGTSAACFPKTFECCGSAGYDEATHKCCGGGLVCPKAATCCGDRECCSGGEVCTTEGCKAPTAALAFRRRSAAPRRHAPAAGV